ncbi:hypothetical protein GGI12_000299 [Dipsacomyces acuminosporus]|nr:hypothetical protein GGI12_000299 [Dipsacomyces acuminosporus]
MSRSSEKELAKDGQLMQRDSVLSTTLQNNSSSNSSTSSTESTGSDDEASDTDQFFETSEDVRVSDTQDTSRAISLPPSLPSSVQTCSSMPQVSTIPGITADDPLQKGVTIAVRAVWMFLDSDFEQVEALLHHKRRSLLYASEGYAAIQYLRSMLTFTKEAMQEAHVAAEDTINLATYFRKPRGVGALLSGSTPQSGTRSGSPQMQQAPSSSQQRHHSHDRSSRYHTRSSEKNSPKPDSEGSRGLHERGEHRRRFHLDSPRLALHKKKDRAKKDREGSGSHGSSALSASSSAANLNTATFPGGEEPFAKSTLDANASDVESFGYVSEDSATYTSVDDTTEATVEERLYKPAQRSWTSGLTSVANSLIGVVRAGTQAVGISKPEWHGLKTMTPIQRHAELVHAEAYLLRAVLNIAMGESVMALLKEGWHVRSSYSTYRGCYAYIQDVYANGGQVDDHFVSGAYLGMGVFNLILSMMPAKLLRFIELVGFSADRRLGLELLAIAAGWRSDPLTKDLLGPPPKISSSSNSRPTSNSSAIHPCGYGLRSEFCSLVLLVYHIFLCNEMCLGYPNQPLVDAVLRRSIQQHPTSLIFMFFDGRSLMVRTRLEDAIERYNSVIKSGRGAVQNIQTTSNGQAKAANDDQGDDALIAELSALNIEETPDEESKSPTPADAAVDGKTDNSKEWRQLQYLGYWDRSLCLMALGRWVEAAKGFNTLRKENNWNKAVYTYALAACMWEHYLDMCSGIAPTETSDLGPAPKALLKIVQRLMKLVPALKRKVAGKSIPIEKFVVRKARKFREQDGFLMRPGLELLQIWGLYGKIPRDRLAKMRAEIDRDIEQLSQFVPTQRAPENPYRHIFYYDDLAILLLSKGCILRELAYPSHEHTQPNANACSQDGSGSPELAPIAEDTFLRLLRLAPLIQRDHYQAVSGRFHLANLYLATKSNDAKRRREWAVAQWKCILSGRPLTSPPCLSFDEYHAIMQDVSVLHKDSKESQKDKIFAAPTCLIEEMILEGSGHSSLQFYDGSLEISDWRWAPPYWSDSKKYSLQNMLEVRTFNADNRLQETLL